MKGVKAQTPSLFYINTVNNGRKNCGKNEMASEEGENFRKKYRARKSVKLLRRRAERRGEGAMVRGTRRRKKMKEEKREKTNRERKNRHVVRLERQTKKKRVAEQRIPVG